MPKFTSYTATYFLGFQDDEGHHRIGKERFRFTEKRASLVRGGTTLGALGYRKHFSHAAVERMLKSGRLCRTKEKAADTYLCRLEDRATRLRAKLTEAIQDHRDAAQGLPFELLRLVIPPRGSVRTQGTC